MAKNPAAVQLGTLGGKATSPRKKQSSAENGKKGGRLNMAIMRQFCGWLTADLPELHQVEVPRMEDSLQRFLKVRASSTEGER